MPIAVMLSAVSSRFNIFLTYFKAGGSNPEPSPYQKKMGEKQSFIDKPEAVAQLVEK